MYQPYYRRQTLHQPYYRRFSPAILREKASTLLKEDAPIILQEDAPAILQEKASTLLKKNAPIILQEDAPAIIQEVWDRDGKTFQRASNAGVNLFLARVKCVENFTLFCCKRHFTLFWLILKGFYLVNF